MFSGSFRLTRISALQKKLKKKQMFPFILVGSLYVNLEERTEEVLSYDTHLLPGGGLLTAGEVLQMARQVVVLPSRPQKLGILMASLVPETGSWRETFLMRFKGQHRQVVSEIRKLRLGVSRNSRQLSTLMAKEAILSNILVALKGFYGGLAFHNSRKNYLPYQIVGLLVFVRVRETIRIIASWENNCVVRFGFRPGEIKEHLKECVLRGSRLEARSPLKEGFCGVYVPCKMSVTTPRSLVPYLLEAFISRRMPCFPGPWERALRRRVEAPKVLSVYDVETQSLLVSRPLEMPLLFYRAVGSAEPVLLCEREGVYWQVLAGGTEAERPTTDESLFEAKGVSCQ